MLFCFLLIAYLIFHLQFLALANVLGFADNGLETADDPGLELLGE